jgi:FkbM family methyltransferase
MKDTLKGIARTFGINLCSNDHLGVDIELDLARLTATEPLGTIFDVGGNFGQTALLFAKAFPAATIYTFEPVPSSFSRLQKAVCGHNRIKLFNTALGDKAGTITMNLTQSAGSNTILQSSAATGSVTVTINTIDSFVTTNAIEVIDLLKIDVEGYELPVIEGAAQLIKRGGIRYIYAECVLPKDDQSPHTSFFDLHQVLDKNGFCFVTYYGEGFRLSDGCALGNVLYALRSKLPAKASGRILNIA